MRPYFNPSDVRSAFACRFAFDWRARSRGDFRFDGAAVQFDALLNDVAVRQGYHVLARAVDPDRLKTLLSLTPFVSPASVSRFVKGNLAVRLRRGDEGIRWSRGTFFRSNGDMTDDAVAGYVARQYQRHVGRPPAHVRGASYRHPGDPKHLRRSAHSTFEYNVHCVFVTQGWQSVLDDDIADSLVRYWRRVCEKKRLIPWNIEVVWNHAHLFLGLNPTDSPGAVALNLLNNAEWFLQRRYSTGLRDVVSTTIWRPGFYVGTVGASTTAEIGEFLRRAL